MVNRLQKLPRKCIFCGIRNANSKEHFYSAWMAPLLPTFKEQSYRQIQTTSHPVRGEQIERDKVKPGHLHSRRIMAVCGVCNSSWMNRAESAARPILEAMIEGRNMTILRNGMEDVARWIAIKTIVAEQSDITRSTTPADTRKALIDGAIPEEFQIYVCSHSSPSGSGYARQTSSIVLPGERPVDFLASGRPNIQQVTWIMGKSIVHVNAAFETAFTIESAVRSGVYNQSRIWPPDVTPNLHPFAIRVGCSLLRRCAGEAMGCVA